MDELKEIVKKVYEIIDSASDEQKAIDAYNYFHNDAGNVFCLLELGLSEAKKDLNHFSVMKNAFLYETVCKKLGDYPLILHYVMTGLYNDMKEDTEHGSKGVKKVYIAELSNGIVKIGVSKNPTTRLKAIANGSGCQIVNFWTSDLMDDAYIIEHQLHSIFKSKRMKGEFFKVDFNEVVKTAIREIVKSSEQIQQLAYLTAV